LGLRSPRALPFFGKLDTAFFLLPRGDAELFLPFEDFPWFRDAPVGKVLNVQELSPGHFYWPDLDIDLSAEIIANPGKYPLLAQQ
jgi:Protein of unknown function (DUF2442)